MKIFRFMSKVEFEKYKNNFPLINNKIHEGKTNSVGFCFFNIEDYTPEEAMHFLSGLVSFEICAVFETDENLSQTYGIYAKHTESSGDPRIDLIRALCGCNPRFTATEYCTTRYEKEKFRLIKYSENIWQQYDEREKQKELKWKEEYLC